METRITLSMAAADRLRKPVVGEGGFQSLLRRLQRCLHGNTLVITDPDLIERMNRYRADYGSGGWQGRLGLLGERQGELGFGED